VRILLFPASYYPVLGGLQTASHELARQFQKAGHTVRVATQRYPRRLAAKEVVDGIPVQRWLFLQPELVHLRRLRPDLFLAGLYYEPLVTRQLQAFFNDFQPDIVNVHFPDSQATLVMKMHRLFRFKLVVSLHGHDVERWRGETAETSRKLPRFRGFQELIRAADSIITCSNDLLQKAKEVCPDIALKGHVVYNGLDLSRFANSFIYDHPRPYILAYGRLNPVKGFDILLRAFAQSAGDLPEIDLILAGDGPERENLIRISRELEIADRILFFGQASPSEIVPLLNGSRLVIVPSRQESFGLAALEAMAAGKPVLATRVGGLPEIIPEEGNILVSPEIDSLAQGLVKMIQDPRTSLGNSQNRLHAMDFTWDNASKQYREIFTRSFSPGRKQ